MRGTRPVASVARHHGRFSLRGSGSTGPSRVGDGRAGCVESKHSARAVHSRAERRWLWRRPLSRGRKEGEVLLPLQDRPEQRQPPQQQQQRRRAVVAPILCSRERARFGLTTSRPTMASGVCSLHCASGDGKEWPSLIALLSHTVCKSQLCASARAVENVRRCEVSQGTGARRTGCDRDCGDCHRARERKRKRDTHAHTEAA